MIPDELRLLIYSLNRWDGRRRQQQLLRGIPRGLLAGLLLALGAALLSRARPLLTRSELGLLAVALALIGLSLAGLIIMLRRRSPTNKARFADRQFNLRERMTAAVEIQSGRLVVDEEIAIRQLRDAAHAAAAVDATRDLPLKVQPADWLPVLAALALLIILLWLPNPQETILLEQRTVAETVAEQTQSLEELAAEIAANDSLTAEQQAALQRPLDEALAALEQPGINREEAVATLSEAEAELRGLSQEFDNAELRQALAEAATDLEGSAMTSDLTGALQAGQMGQAAAAAGALADSLDSLSAEEQATLAEQLAQAASDLQAVDPQLADALERAAEALAEGDSAAAQDAMNDVASTLGEQEQSAAAAEQAGSAADRLAQSRGETAQSGSGGQQPGSGGGSTPGNSQSGGSQGGNQGGQGSAQGSVGGPSQGGGHVENVFVPGAADLSGEGQDLELEALCLANPEACGPLGSQRPSGIGQNRPGGSQVPYDQVFGDYRDAAFEALVGGNIPVNLQSIIRDYFSALEP